MAEKFQRYHSPAVIETENALEEDHEEEDPQIRASIGDGVKISMGFENANIHRA